MSIHCIYEPYAYTYMYMHARSCIRDIRTRIHLIGLTWNAFLNLKVKYHRIKSRIKVRAYTYYIS